MQWIYSNISNGGGTHRRPTKVYGGRSPCRSWKAVCCCVLFSVALIAAWPGMPLEPFLRKCSGAVFLAPTWFTRGAPAHGLPPPVRLRRLRPLRAARSSLSCRRRLRLPQTFGSPPSGSCPFTFLSRLSTHSFSLLWPLSCDSDPRPTRKCTTRLDHTVTRQCLFPQAVDCRQSPVLD